MPCAGDMTALCDGVMAWRDPRRSFYKKLRGTRKTGFQPVKSPINDGQIASQLRVKGPSMMDQSLAH